MKSSWRNLFHRDGCSMKLTRSEAMLSVITFLSTRRRACNKHCKIRWSGK